MIMKFSSVKIGVASLLSVLSLSVAAAGITTKTVNASGFGPDRREALNAALVEAVAKVRGLSVANVQATTRAASSSKVAVAGKTVGMDASHESGFDATASETHGSVKSYEVLDAKEDAKGRWQVKISADISVYESDASNNRRRIAFVPFRMPEEQSPAQAKRYEAVAQRLSLGAVDYVTSTRHFSVVDRTYDGERLVEFLRLLLPDVGRDERARIGNSSGTDYLVVGDILSFDSKESTVIVPYTKEKITKSETNATVSWRVLEAATGQVLASGTIKKSYPSMDVDVARQIGEEIGEKITDIIYPIVTLDYNNGRISLAQGGSSMKVGRVYQLNRYGKVQTDPYTHEPMAREEIPVGKVRIVSVSPKISYAEVVDCRVDLTGMGPKEYVLRALPEESGSRGGRKIRKTMTPNW